MRGLLRLRAPLVAAAMLFGLASGANAIQCPESGTRNFITLSGGDLPASGVSCYEPGTGNFNLSGNNDLVNQSGDPPFVTLFKTDDGVFPAGQGGSYSITGVSGLSGLVSFTLPDGYVNAVLSFTTGAGQNDPRSISFLFTGITSISNVSWALGGTAPINALSHANVYGQIPLPAAAWLMLAGLGGLGLVSRRRKSRPALA